MDHKRDIPQRRSIRLPDYDYNQPGAYFITIVTHRHLCIFGEVRNDQINLNDIGKIVEETWREIPEHFPNVTNEYVVVMPNHLHGVILIQKTSVRARLAFMLRRFVPRPYVCKAKITRLA